jgi:mono/diheme cytochrome c family protein
MHHVYARRIVISLVSFFLISGLLFGPVVRAIRSGPEASNTTSAAGATSAEGESQEDGSATESTAGAITLPNGQAAFDNLCASCHKMQEFSNKVANSLDPDAASLAQLEKLVGPPPHGGASPAEALAIVIQIRSVAGLPSDYPAGVPTPPAAATAAASEPTATPLPAGAILITEDYEGIWVQICADCHRAERFVEGLQAETDPDLRTWQAIEYLSGPPTHYNRPLESFLPAMNYIREQAGLEPLIP